MAGRVIEIAGRKVGEGYPPIISAEVGLNHCGNMTVARSLVFAAKDAGCDAVKFQNYRTADFVKNRNEMYVDGRGVEWNMWNLCQQCELAFEDLGELKYYADKAGIIFHSTPTSREGVDDLVKLGVPVLKNGADYWENSSLCTYMIQEDMPLVFSTAAGYGQDDLWWDVATSRPYQMIILHTVREYPAKYWHRERFEFLYQTYPLVGYSDHTIGIDAAVEAVKLGACWIEKHFTLDKTMDGPDHWFSADPQEMRQLVEAVGGCESKEERAIEKLRNTYGFGW